MAEYIQIAGKSNIYVGFADAPASLFKLGEQLDETRLEFQQYMHDVPGDRHGGPQGPPIERQILGGLFRGVFNLSRWNPDLLPDIHGHNVYAVHGAIADSEIGTLLFRDNYFRFLISPAKDNTSAELTYDPFVYNFVCCSITTPIVIGQGTKFSTLQFSFEAHRAPEGHPQAGVIWNRDDTGESTADGT